jgi:hypothetical protein
MKGYVYRKNERVEAYVAVSAGKQGIYLMPYLHPDIITEAPAVFESVIRQVHSAANLPIYALVRRYQPWLEGALETLAFDPWAQQAVMVRHIAAGVRQASFSPLRRGTKAVTSSLSPPSSQMLSQPSVHLSAEGTHNGSQE